MKSYAISVSLGPGCYRHIQIGADETLDELHCAILSAFDFDDDHAHAFFMDDRYWSDADVYYDHRMDDGGRFSDEVTLRQLQLKAGKKFKFLFDFGDEWRFQCKVLRELDEKTARPKIIRAAGKASEQYPSWDEEDDEDDESSLTKEE